MPPRRYAPGVLSAVRPTLLPEDYRYIGADAAQIEAAVPGLARWLDRVFLVIGGHSLPAPRARGVGLVAALAGVTSVGVMTIVNFVLASDYRWLLLGFLTLWAVGVVLYAVGK